MLRGASGVRALTIVMFGPPNGISRLETDSRDIHILVVLFTESKELAYRRHENVRIIVCRVTTAVKKDDGRTRVRTRFA